MVAASSTSPAHHLPVVAAQVTRAFLDSDAPRTAVFDADGTLWRGDVGEDFLRFLAASGALEDRGRGAFARYESLHQTHPEAAYAFAVEVMAGLLDMPLRSMCQQFFEQRFAGRVFPFVRPLLASLARAQVEVWVCSASPRWIVEAGAEALGLDPARVIGVESVVEGGRLTASIVFPITAGRGKVTHLRQRGVDWGFACGNGELDLEMLEAARYRLVIAPPDGAENGLVQRARAEGWPILKV
jgi:phosphoserine phosphatase